ncbi:MAG TPA: endonuclease NucS [Acidimicrobiales bacterium]|nr:endonuclease NucS [Acidimicrobiales bacterium]
MRLVIATCSVDYLGRLTAHLPMATRLILIKADGSVSIHSDDRAYKPLNWMTYPCTLTESSAGRWVVENPKGEKLLITIEAIHSDVTHELGVDPGLEKDGVEAHLQELLAANPEVIEEGLRLVRREYPTDIGPVDLMCRDRDGNAVIVEIKRIGEINAVDQLSRYLERLGHETRLDGLRGMLVASAIKPQASVLARTRGIGCVEVDYDALRGLGTHELKLF